LILVADGVSVRDLSDDDVDRLAAWRRLIGDRIRDERLRQNQTQETLYLAAGIARYTLQRAESGADVQVSTLQRIADALEVPLSELVR
jgi:transcriptional regulator with XRE-family HTH domain